MTDLVSVIEGVGNTKKTRAAKDGGKPIWSKEVFTMALESAYKAHTNDEDMPATEVIDVKALFLILLAALLSWLPLPLALPLALMLVIAPSPPPLPLWPLHLTQPLLLRVPRGELVVAALPLPPPLPPLPPMRLFPILILVVARVA
jgi:hypothetical protein